MYRKIKYISLTLLAFMIISCVPVRKFEDLKKDEQACKEERDNLRFKNKELETKNTEISDQITELNKQIERLEKDTAYLGTDYRRLKETYDKILDLNKTLKNQQKELAQNSEAEARKILKELQKTQEILQKKEDNLRELERTLDKREEDLEKLQKELAAKNEVIEKKNKDLEERSRELISLQNKLSSMDSIVNALKDKVSSALTGYEGNGLTVEQKNGKVYVSMDNKLLFKSGSYSLDQKGKEAITKLGSVLETNPDVNIMIEGHTDSDAYNGKGVIKDNWDLSVMRATAVLKELLDGTTIDAKRVTAAGRGEFVPIDPADTKEAKAKNRRTEIILTPKLDELFKIIGSN
jgi:chemotaxis protein MotB